MLTCIPVQALLFASWQWIYGQQGQQSQSSCKLKRNLPREFLEDLSIAWLDRKESTRSNDALNNPPLGEHPLPRILSTPPGQTTFITLEDLPQPATEAQLASRRIKMPKLGRHTPEQKPAPGSSPQKSNQRKPRVKLPPSVPPPDIKLSMGSVLDAVIKLDEGEGGSRLNGKEN
ncbi:hypothetical protein BDW59DRAFT_103884 [Aspergillus cavernicola]|uniref:Uncharacterized protein n=1 Tax=Aspergillus cavernicola TaxID=176166 RepID=A0ABR4I5Z5_9EURO